MSADVLPHGNGASGSTRTEGGLRCASDFGEGDSVSMTNLRAAVSTVVVKATREDGAEAAAVHQCPPTSEDVRRIAALASMPGLAGAGVLWSATPGDSSR